MKRKSFIIVVEVIGLMVLYFFVNSSLIEILPSCWVYDFTKIQCPACGGTRCIMYLLEGKWREAFFSHMVFFIGIIYIILVDIIYIINFKKKEKIGTWIYPKYWYSIIFVILLIFYTIIRNLL